MKVEITTFTTMDEAVEKLRTGSSKFDVFFPTPDVIGKVVAGKLLQPINKSYITNFEQRLARAPGPVLRQGLAVHRPVHALHDRRRVPAPTGSTTARRAPTATTSSGTPAYKGRVYILNDDREALGMALIRSGDHRRQHRGPGADREGARATSPSSHRPVDVKTGIEAYQRIPDGTATVHQAWSGDAVNAQYYLPDGGDVADDRVLVPARRRSASIGSDTLAIPANAEHPVLAHLFLDYMLERRGRDRQLLVARVPAAAELARSRDGRRRRLRARAPGRRDRPRGGLRRRACSCSSCRAAGEAAWDNAWSKFTTGA